MADKVTELELKNIIGQEINNSMGYMGGNLSAQRKKSLEYYMGEPLGTEIDGRSQVVSTDVADTVETILPNLLKISVQYLNVIYVCSKLIFGIQPLILFQNINYLFQFFSHEVA